MTSRLHSPSVATAAASGAALLLLGLLFLTACGGSAPAAKEVWYCPMHPTYISDRPGACPICNMDLVRKDGAGTPSGAGASGSASSVSEKEILHYRSPMDPTVTSPVPAKDAMGMDYVPVYVDEIRAAEASSVAGRAMVEDSGEGLRLAGVRTEPARLERLAQTVRTVGTVRADERRLFRAQTKIGGWVETLYVNFDGQYVRKGQPMLAIYTPEFFAVQSEYLAALEASRRIMASSLPEVRRGADDLALAARRRIALFDLPESVLEELERTRVARRTIDLVAPASGYVIEKSIVSGQRIDPGMELLTIADLSRVWIEADFYESEARFVAPGLEAKLRLPFDPTMALSARVSYVYPQLALETRTLRVRFDVDNPELRLKPGMYVDVELATRLGEGIVVPDSAILDSGVRQLVFVETAPGRFAPREVEVELRADGKALVSEGLVAGERVAVKANFLLDSESRLRAAIASMANGTRSDAQEGPRP